MQNELLWHAAYAGCVSMLVVFFAVGGATTIREDTMWISKQAQSAAVFFVASITSEQIRNDYRAMSVASQTASDSNTSVPMKKVRVLIVPGHRPDIGGTIFGGVHERDVVVDIADALATKLSQDSHYEVMVARTKTAWNPILQSYFDTNAYDIKAFYTSQKIQMKKYLANGRILENENQVDHNTAPPKAVLQLYGINKWASDNNYSIVLHLHINDEAGRSDGVAGKYNGFAIYVPDHQYSNAEASKTIGRSIASRLNMRHATSTFPKEGAGVVEDQQLIAIGSNNSVDSASLLIEYGYIYESQFQDASIRPIAVADYAQQTYLGLQDFFENSAPTTRIASPNTNVSISGNVAKPAAIVKSSARLHAKTITSGGAKTNTSKPAPVPAVSDSSATTVLPYDRIYF